MMSESFRILFVEDDPSGRALGAFNLRRAGYEVDVAESGEQALVEFSPQRHDLVLTDIRMREVSGLDVLAYVKRLAPNIPVVLITACAGTDVALRAIGAGAHAYLVKPFAREHLCKTLSRALVHAARSGPAAGISRQR